MLSTKFKKLVMSIAAGGSIALAGTASADILFSFGFTDLDGDWDASTSVFSAIASNHDGLISGGDVTRQVDPIGTAEFDTGFFGAGTSANYEMSMTLSNITSGSADVLAGDAGFTVTDADGDIITGDIIGTWTAGMFGFMFFNGHIDNVVFSDPNGEFNGSSGGFFDTDFSPADQPYEGAIVTLSISGNGGFFDAGDFSDASTLVDAQVIPTPTALVIAGLGSVLCLTGRRRR